MAKEEPMTFARVFAILITLFVPWTMPSANPAQESKTVYDFALVGLDGKEVSLSVYKGKVLLIVNLASKSIYREQLEALSDLQKTYSDKGLVVIGIPSADFGSQETEDSSELKKFYFDTEHVNFPVYSKATLRGKNPVPLVGFLTDPKTGAGGGDIHWNFTKFVIDRQGKAVLRFEADSDPADPEFRATIEKVLDGTFKKPAVDNNSKKSGADDESEERE